MKPRVKMISEDQSAVGTSAANNGGLQGSWLPSSPRPGDDALGRGLRQPARETPFPLLGGRGSNVSYFAVGDVDSQRHIEGLKLLGFDVKVCSDRLLAGLETFEPDGIPIVVLHASPATALLGVARLRSLLPSAWLIVTSEFPDKVSRVAAMLAGADTCADASLDSLELAATVLAATRRREPRPAGRKVPPHTGENRQSKAWSLTNDGWTLNSPNGKAIELNQIEREIMRDLIEKSNEPLMRSSHAASGANDRVSRNLDVAVSRLRKKAAEHSVHLPIKSIRGVGYVFVAEEAL